MPFYVRYQGKKQGPLSDAQMTTLLCRGQLDRNTEATLDEQNWKPLGEFPEFEQLYAKAIDRQLNTESAIIPPPVSGPPAPPALPRSSGPTPPPLPGTPAAANQEPDLFELAGFSHDDYAQKVDSILQSVSVPSGVPQSVATGVPLTNNSKNLFIFAGIGLVLVVLLGILITLSSGLASPAPREVAKHSDEESFEEEQQHDSAAEETQRRQEEEQREKQARAEAEQKAKEEREAHEAEERQRQEAARKAEEERIAEEERQRKQLNAELLASVEGLGDSFPFKPLRFSATGSIQSPNSLKKGTDRLWSQRDKVQFRYVSYVPKPCFSANNKGPHEVVLSLSGESSDSGHEIFRVILNENGLQGEWLDTAAITTENYQQANGIMLGELEIRQNENNGLLKTLPFCEPVSAETFRPSLKKIPLVDFSCDFASLGFQHTHFVVFDAKGYRAKYDWQSQGGDVLDFEVGENDRAQIRIVPRDPIVDRTGDRFLPIDVQEIGRNSPLIREHISATRTQPEQVESKIEIGTKATNQARSEMLHLRKTFNRNNSKANKAAKTITSLNIKLKIARGNVASQISSQISAQRSIISSCRSANVSLGPQVSRATKRHDDYLQKLKKLQSFEAFLKKPSVIYNGEPMTFNIRIAHPLDSNRYLTLLTVKEPDLSNEKDAVMPELPKDDEIGDDMEDDETEDDDMNEDVEDENGAGETKKTRSFLGGDNE